MKKRSEIKDQPDVKDKRETGENRRTDDLFTKRTELVQNFKAVRFFSCTLCNPLKTEDYVIQSMPDASPAKWHLAHTSWFFENFVLKKFINNYSFYNPVFNYLFNSYYVQAGNFFTRSMRGLVSRPTVSDVCDYRKHIDDNVLEFLDKASDKEVDEAAPLIELGLNHEQQHQELILTDIKHMFSLNPLYPIYCNVKESPVVHTPPIEWLSFDEGITRIGYDGKGFSFDNERPVHNVYLEPYKLASRLVTNGDYLDFIEAGGYSHPELWLSDGWAIAEQEQWQAPLYWQKRDGEWLNFTLGGLMKLNPSEPVCHVSFYEADAYARWAGFRLPKEEEWEAAASDHPIDGNFVENGIFHPAPVMHNIASPVLHQMYGDVWEWTSSPYTPYPGFKPLQGTLGEYNGKFMANQMVLRGGSCATSLWHIRRTYRNFFHPEKRWQFTGIRLAKDVPAI
ncbi:MAG TPA: ergothioneine biosynthesis protein EgtB [Ignavibacteriales bacterium]|nr:ergothioneine biosynthesis protein EgtB [Ignavibacteriales bacterium]